MHRAALLLAVVGALHGLVYAPLVSDNLAPDTPPYRAGADALLDGSYSTPLSASFYYELRTRSLVDITGRELDRDVWNAPERHIFRPPGYPALLALVGNSIWGAIVAQALLFGAGTYLLVLTTGRWWGRRVGLASGAVYAFDPFSKHYVALLLSEALAAFLCLACAYALTRAWRARGVGWWAAAGAFAGALTLVRVVFVVAVVLLLVAALSSLRRAAAVALAAGALLVPWLAWTASVAGKPVLASYGEGYNLLLAAHGESLAKTQTDVLEDPRFVRDVRAAQETLPSPRALRDDPEAHPRYVVRADEEMRERALRRYGERIRTEPHLVAWEVVYRGFFLWNAHEDWYQPHGVALLALRVFDWLVLLLAIAGAWLAWRRGGPARAVVVFLLVYTVAIATHHVEARFAMPLRGLYLAFATLAVAGAIAKAQSQNADAALLPAENTND